VASSTTKPIAKTIAKRVSVFNVKPNTKIKKNTPIKEMGIVIKGIKEALKERKK